MKHIRSRIHEYIKPELMTALKDICLDVKNSDNNTKVRLIRDVLAEHKLDYHELGPGTNRFAILIDGYVFKIAMDKWGVLDNDNEFSMTEVLQPFVTTVYETNGLLSVSEYVTLISKEEFTEKKNDIIKILSILSEGFLLGDVGYAPKNFANWGYRTDGSLVILDFAYIYNIVGDEIMCQKDGNILQYDENFNFMRCPYCRKKYDTIAIRRLIPKEHEMAEIAFAKKAAYELKTELMEVDDEEDKIEVKEETNKEEDDMTHEFSDEEREQGFMNIFNAFGNKDQYNKNKVTARDEIEPEDKDEEDILSDVVNTVAHNTPIKQVDEEEYDDEPVYEDPISMVISALGGNVKPTRVEPQEDEKDPDEEKFDDYYNEPRLTPLEMMMVAQGAAEPEDFLGENTLVEVQQHDFAKDDGIEDNPEDYENPGQITYVLDKKEEPKEEPKAKEEVNTSIDCEEVQKHFNEEPQKTTEDASIEKEEAQPVVEQEAPIEKQVVPDIEEDDEEDDVAPEDQDLDGLEDNTPPIVNVASGPSVEGEVLNQDIYDNMADGIIYPDDDEDEDTDETSDKPIEEQKHLGIKRIGSTSNEEEKKEPEIQEDFMALVTKVHEEQVINVPEDETETEQDKYDKMAQDHLGRDPLDY